MFACGREGLGTRLILISLVPVNSETMKGLCVNLSIHLKSVHTKKVIKVCVRMQYLLLFSETVIDILVYIRPLVFFFFFFFFFV